jgi:hypothetical protein
MRIAVAILLAATAGLWTGSVTAAPRSWIQFDQVQAHERRDRHEMRPQQQRQPVLQAPQRSAPPPPPAQNFVPRSEPPPSFNAPQPAAPRLSPGDAARRAQQQYGGRVLSVYPAGDGYRVKMLRDGEVSVVSVPNE